MDIKFRKDTYNDLPASTKVKVWQTARGFSTKEAAEKCNVRNANTVVKWRLGINNPSPGVLDMIYLDLEARGVFEDAGNDT